MSRTKKFNMVKFRPCAGFYLYLCALLFAAVFTQALRSHISAILYIFFIALPAASLILTFAASASIQIYLNSPQQTVPRRTPVTVSLQIVNASILPIPFAECALLLPGSGHDRRLVKFSLAPASAYTVSETLIFKYRGEYEIGVAAVYMRDLFGLFRLRADIGSFTCVYVRPRRLTLLTRFPAAKTERSDTHVNLRPDSELGDAGELRPYSDGDSPRDILWKLSAKSDELTVRQRLSDDSDRVNIVLDLAGSGDGTDTERGGYILDAVVEAAVSLCCGCVENGSACTVMWYDKTYEGGLALRYCDSREVCDDIYTALTSVKLCEAGQTFAALSPFLNGISGESVIIISARCDGEISDIIGAARSGGRGESTAVSLCFIDYSAVIADEDELRRYGDFKAESERRLSSDGVRMLEPFYAETERRG